MDDKGRVRAIIFTYLSTLIGFSLGFVFSVLIARLLQPYQLGIYSLGMSSAGIIGSFTTLGLGTALVRYLPLIRRKESNNTIQNYIITAFLMLISFVFLVSLLWFYIGEYLVIYIFKDNNLIYVFHVCSLLIFSSALSILIKNILRGFEEFKILNLLTIFFAVLSLIFPLCLVYFFGSKAPNVIYGLVLSNIVIVIYGIIFLKRKKAFLFNNIRFNKSICRKLLSYGLPMMPGVIFLSLMGTLDKFFLGVFLDISSVGYYAVASGIAVMVSSFATPIGVVLFPSFSGLLAEGNNSKVSQYVNGLFSIGLYIFLPLGFGIALFSKSIILSLFGPIYEAAIHPLMILIIGIVFYSFYVLFRGYIGTVKKTTVFIKMLVPSVIINLILNLILIPVYGLSGAAFATSFSYVILGCVTLFYVKKSINIDISKIEPKKFLTITIVLFFISYILKDYADNLLIIAIFGLLILILYFMLLWLLKVRWFFDILRILFNNN